MAVHIKLEPERGPCRNAKTAKPEFFINEIDKETSPEELVVKTFIFNRIKN